jgi:hypothetical protein
MRVVHTLAGLALATTFGASAAVAVPLARPAEMPAQSAEFEIEKVHGWHSYCARGPARWHRHVPGAGNVPCAPRRVYRAPPPARVIVVPRPGPRIYVRPGRRW